MATSAKKPKITQDDPPSLKYVPVNIKSLSQSAKSHTESCHPHTHTVGERLQAHHSKLLKFHYATRSTLCNKDLTPRQRVKALVDWASKEEQVEVPVQDPTLDQLVDIVAPIFCDMAADPNNFDPRSYPHVFKPTSEEELVTLGQRHQVYYIRVYKRSRAKAQDEFVTYLNRQPIDAGFATANMSILGMADAANQALPEVLKICGFEGASYPVENSDVPMPGAFVQSSYGGTTCGTAEARRAHDAASKPQTRLTHFLEGADKQNVTVFEIRPWRIPIENPLEWRSRPILSDLERILVFCLSLPLNSALGGFIPRYRAPSPVREACEKVMASLPDHIDGLQNASLATTLEKQIDREARFIGRMREKDLPVGPKITDDALPAVKSELTGSLRTVNGFVVCLWLLREVTGEDFLGVIASGFFSADMGCAMALLWDRLQVIHQYEGTTSDQDLRLRLGPFLNVWRLTLVRRYWGLVIVMLIIILGHLNPLFIVGFSASVSHTFLHSVVLDIATDTKLDGQLKQSILDHPRIKALMSPPTFRKFQDFVGKLQVVSTGAEPHQLALFLPVIHPGREFYRPWILLPLLRVGFLVTFKGVVTQRVLAQLATTSPPAADAGSRRSFLLRAKAEVEERLEREGLETTLMGWLQELKEAETVDAILRGKHVVHGELVRHNSGNPRCYRNRDTGNVAKGERDSPERLAQLEDLIKACRTTKDNGLSVLKGPGGCTPMDETFAIWFLSRSKGVSLLWSTNRLGRSAESFQAALKDKDRLALFNKVEALATREADARKYGGYRRSVFLKRFERATFDVLRGRLSSFAQAIVIVVCKRCGQGDIGFDQNTQHRCKIEDEKKDATFIKLGARGSTANFDEYLRVLYLHDLLDRAITLEYINDQDLDELGVFSVPAIDFLVDEHGERLADLPPFVDITKLDNDVIWRREDTPRHVLLASALDVAARTTAEAHDARHHKGTGTAAFGSLSSYHRKALLGSIHAPSQDKLWADNFWKSMAAAISHNPAHIIVTHHKDKECLTFLVRSSNVQPSHRYPHACTEGAGKVDHRDYVFDQASNFGQLPYVIQRVCIYKAIVEQDRLCRQILMWD